MTDVTPVAPWLVESCRFTGFVPAGATPDTKNWFAQAAQTPAESSTSRPPVGQHVEQGVVESGKLTLAISPGRFDWTYGPPDVPANEIRSIGALDTVVPAFRGVIERWLPQCPTLGRLATGLVLVRPVKTRTDGYRDLARYLGFLRTLDFEDAEDFFYAINRPRQSTHGNIIVNRISRWSVVKFQTVQIQIDLGGSRPQVVPVDVGWGARLDLDVNTKPGAESELPIPVSKAFSELVSMALEISQKGDIK
ncbi:hypothetical protein [Candidatus Binatus sp.]|jgi:hypothetical protein|uniref:hypothetical protein n=1 Tax=Candidatus Binatus sp. TaxID=2811406 RepID=UPI003CADD9BF